VKQHERDVGVDLSAAVVVEGHRLQRVVLVTEHEQGGVAAADRESDDVELRAQGGSEDIEATTGPKPRLLWLPK
jgi:hypothetical protein